MKLNVLYIIFLVFAVSANAQIDSKKKSGVIIPATEGKKDSSNIIKVFPSKTINSNPASRIAIPKISTNLNVPKKEFSMFGEKFGNPGELYEDRLKNKTKDIEVEMGLGTKGSATDQYFGDFKTKSQFIRIIYRDFGAEDGDLISILVNDDIIEHRILLTNGYKGFKLDLKPGFNKIDFLALNEGYALPNTAEFQVIDDTGKVIASNRWNLSTGVKGTIVFVKE